MFLTGRTSLRSGPKGGGRGGGGRGAAKEETREKEVGAKEEGAAPSKGGRGEGRGGGRGRKSVRFEMREAPLPVILPQATHRKQVAPSILKETTVPEPASKKEMIVQSIGTGSRLSSLVCAEQFRNSLPQYTIDSVRFSFMGDAVIRKLSVVNCISSDYSGQFSINSNQMGTVDRTLTCGKCGQIDIECQGHLGRIELATPLPHPLAIDQIIHVLRSVCSNCGRLLLPKSRRDDPFLMRLSGAARLREIAKIVSSSGNLIMCPRNLEISARRNSSLPVDSEEVIGKWNSCSPPKWNTAIVSSDREDKGEESMCPAVNPKYCVPHDKDQWQIIASLKIRGVQKVTRVSIERIRNIFSNIPPEDLVVMGFSGNSRPENFIMSCLPVIPERCRPPVEREGERKQDHITLVYTMIIRENRKLGNYLADQSLGRLQTESGGSIENSISTSTRNLFFLISHIMNNTDGKLKLRLGESANTLAERITGKEGFCRAPSQGKRVNFCARTVIGPGVIPFGAILVPEVMRILTIPERIHRFNIQRIRKLYDSGEIAHYIPSTGAQKGIRLLVFPSARDRAASGIQASDLVIGDTIERFATTGDELTVNRQPTLHRHSMIGVRAIFRPGRLTFGLHCAYTTPMNADFDGDESNTIAPQTLAARAEIRGLMSVSNQIISAATSFPVMGLVYNCPTSAFLLSTDAEKDDAEFEERFGKPLRAEIEQWSGRMSELAIGTRHLLDRAIRETTAAWTDENVDHAEAVAELEGGIIRNFGRNAPYGGEVYGVSSSLHTTKEPSARVLYDPLHAAFQRPVAAFNLQSVLDAGLDSALRKSLLEITEAQGILRREIQQGNMREFFSKKEKRFSLEFHLRKAIVLSASSLVVAQEAASKLLLQIAKEKRNAEDPLFATSARKEETTLQQRSQLQWEKLKTEWIGSILQMNQDFSQSIRQNIEPSILEVVSSFSRGGFSLFSEGSHLTSRTLSDEKWNEVVRTLLIDGKRMRTFDRRLARAGVRPRTPRAIFSLVLPEKLTMTYRYTRDSDKRTIVVAIRNGILVQGIVTKSVLSEITHSIFKRFGADMSVRFISETQFILDWFLEERGFSIGIADCIVEDIAAVRNVINVEISKIRVSVDAIEGEFPPETETERMFRDAEISKHLGSIRNVGLRLSAEKMGNENSLSAMVISGAKGSLVNIAQIAGAIGEQFISGAIPERSVYGNRSLSYFEAYDHSIESNGFIVNSFADGMRPSELVYHMEATRVCLLDTAMRTADIGTLAHKTSKVLENSFIGYDSSVVNTAGVYSSLSYGEGYSCESLVFVTAFKSTGGVFMPFNLAAIVEELNNESEY